MDNPSPLTGNNAYDLHFVGLHTLHQSYRLGYRFSDTLYFIHFHTLLTICRLWRDPRDIHPSLNHDKHPAFAVVDG